MTDSDITEEYINKLLTEFQYLSKHREKETHSEIPSDSPSFGDEATESD